MDTAGGRGRTLGEALRAGRLAKGLTQVAAAAELSISQPALSAWENDQQRPTLDRLAKAAHLYGLDFADLLGSILEGAA